MILPGCLAALFLPIFGALIGQWWGGTQASMWGALIGLGLGATILVALGLLVRHLKKHG